MPTPLDLRSAVQGRKVHPSGCSGPRAPPTRGRVRAGLRPSRRTLASKNSGRDRIQDSPETESMLLQKVGVLPTELAPNQGEASPKARDKPLERTSFRRKKPEKRRKDGAGPDPLSAGGFEGAYYNFEEEYSDSETVPESARTTVLVDGYNVCGAWPKLAKLFARGELEKARTRLLDACTPYGTHHGVNLLVVFDAHIAGPGRESRTQILGVDVVFSGSETADKWIENKVAEIAGQKGSPFVTVITSDHGLQTAVAAKGGFIKSTPFFIQELKELIKERVETCLTGNQYLQTSLADGLDQETKTGLLQLRKQVAPNDPFYQTYIVPYDKLSTSSTNTATGSVATVSSSSRGSTQTSNGSRHFGPGSRPREQLQKSHSKPISSASKVVIQIEEQGMREVVKKGEQGELLSAFRLGAVKEGKRDEGSRSTCSSRKGKEKRSSSGAREQLSSDTCARQDPLPAGNGASLCEACLEHTRNPSEGAHGVTRLKEVETLPGASAASPCVCCPRQTALLVRKSRQKARGGGTSLQLGSEQSREALVNLRNSLRRR